MYAWKSLPVEASRMVRGGRSLLSVSYSEGLGPHGGPSETLLLSLGGPTPSHRKGASLQKQPQVDTGPPEGA